MAMALPWSGQIAQHKAAVREGLTIVRKVIARDAVKAGLKTTEIYKLALQETPSDEFKALFGSVPPVKRETTVERGTRRRVPSPVVPHPEHPVRSISFLKHHILPIVEGDRLVKHVREARAVPDVPKAKASKQQVVQSVPQSAPSLIWLWRAATAPPTRNSPQRRSGDRLREKRRVAYDFTHMKRAKQKLRRKREEVRADRARLTAKRLALKAKERSEAMKPILSVKKALAKIAHGKQEEAGLAARAERRKRWEAANPGLAKGFARKVASAEAKAARVAANPSVKTPSSVKTATTNKSLKTRPKAAH